MASKGVVLLALGDQIYGQMAFNACLSMKVNCPEIPVVLYHDNPAVVSLTPRHRRLFDAMQLFPSEYYFYEGKREIFRSKSRMFDFTPFDKTLWLDADVIIHPGKGNQIREIFNSEHDYYAQTYNLIDCNTGKRLVDSIYPDGLWASLTPALVKYYKLKDKALPQINSSFVYFEKTERMRAFFEEVKTIWKESAGRLSKSFRQELPDEFFFHMAGARLGVQTPEIPFAPLYGDHEFQDAYGRWIGDDAVLKNHIGTMLYGLDVPNHIQTIYDTLVERYHDEKNLTKIRPFRHVNKSIRGIRD